MASSESRQALWAAGDDEPVEVNQRALIDKILARYSGEFTVFRELLQNSDDAGARSVEIRFETEEYLSRKGDDDAQPDDSEQEDDDSQSDDSESEQEVLPNLKTAVVHQWTFKNSGIPFREDDWNRLKRIADGNPDEEKIGAFGVGFYSLFSITEEPWVTSGGKWMNFYWKDGKDQLYVRRGTAGDADDVWTTFQMSLREPGPMPPAFDFTRFLVSSIAFMTHLSEVSVFFDDKRLVKLSKNRGVSKEVPMLEDLTSVSPKGTMNVESIETIPLHIEAEVVGLVYEGGSEANSLNIVLTIFAANVAAHLDEKMKGELRRAIKKNPPSELRYELIYMGKDEYDSSVGAEEEAAYATGSVFQGLRADLEGAGSTRVYIGHATGQTTGIGGHMAARFIPTVERESIDLVDRNVAVWNKELLYVGGFLARFAYELELDAIKRLWEGAAAANGSGGRPDEDVQTRLRGRGLHALKFFSFHRSTPSHMVSELMKTTFFSCSTTRPFPILASDGVRDASKVYILNPEFSGFIKSLPVISKDIFDGAKTMVDALRPRGMVKDITFVDVLDELRSRLLSEAETVECLKWWIGVTRGNNRKVSQERPQLLRALVVSVTGPVEKMMKLSDAQTFLKSEIIPTNGPLPSTLLPTSITCSFDRNILVSTFLWRELSTVDWLRHLTDPKVAAANPEFDVTNSASWAEGVLSVLVKAWPSLTDTDKKGVIRILSPISCLPTSTGLKVPNRAYFSNTDLLNLFRDLAIATMPSGVIVEGNLELVLRSLGVRKHVEFHIIFDRMVETGDWSTYDLVNYLVSIQSNMTSQEFERLGETSAFPKENAGREQSVASASQKDQRYKAKDLYEPIDLFRELGLPIIDWGADNQWDPKSSNVRFMYSLNLRQVPPLREILHLAASDNLTVRTKALAFFLDKLYNIYRDYNPQNFRDLAFVPAVLGSEKMLAKPFKVCIDPKWTALGFATVDPMLPSVAAHKLRLNLRPHNLDLLAVLETSPPDDETTACKWFEILSDCVSGFSLDHLQKLSETPFVPVESTGYKGDIKRLRPKQCFLGRQRSELHSKLFPFVNFGKRANEFLKRCHANKEPSAEDIAQVMLADPRRVYELANGRENYLNLLHELAQGKKELQKGTILRMTRSKILGSRRVKGGDIDGRCFEDELLQPSEVVIVNEDDTYRLFGDRIFCAPQVDTIEELYSLLGSPKLSSLVREDYRTSGELPNSKIGTEIRDLILERLPLFLYNQSPKRTKLSSDWMDNQKNFIVKVFERISVVKTLNHGDTHESSSYDTSVISKREGSGPIELLLAENKQLRMHEISTSLCRFIFESTEVHDATLFMAILKGDLSVLKDLGYPVDRILRRKAEREAAERAEAVRKAAEKAEAEREAAEEAIAETEAPSNPIDRILRRKSEREAAEIAEAVREAAEEAEAEHEAAKEAIAETEAPSNPVDRILRRKAERETAEEAETEREAAEEVIAETEAPSNPSAPKMEIPTSGTQPKIPPSDTAIPAPQTDTGSEQTLKSSHGAGHRPSNRPDTSPQPAPPPKSEDTHQIPPPPKPVPLAPNPDTPEGPEPSPKPGPPGIIPLGDIAFSVDVAIKGCKSERGDILRNLANDFKEAVEACAPESDNPILELVNDINMAVEASVPVRDHLLKGLLNKIKAAIGADASERNTLLRNLARKIEMVIEPNNILRNLVNNIGKAIDPGAPASGNLSTSQESLRLDERYCDETGAAMEVHQVGSIGGTTGIDVFAASDLPEPDLLMKRKHKVLGRFLDVLMLLLGVYSVPQTSLHIFADKEGRFISFNRGGNIFLNLRFFEEWHDNDVKKDNYSPALTFWYFMLAHGIAHNLVESHNLKHEFWVSAICEAYHEILIDKLSS